MHVFFVISFIVLISIIFYRVVIHDDIKFKELLRKDILEGKIEYVWSGGFLCKIISIIDDNVVLASLVGSEGDTPGFYIRILDIKGQVPNKILENIGLKIPKIENKFENNDSELK